LINEIITAISVALDSEFGYENHMEEIIQDLKEPCFFISCLNPAAVLFLGKRYFQSNQFDIQYFPETDDKNYECHQVAEKLWEVLEYITVSGDLAEGTKMKYEVVDGVLHFFVNYDCFIYRVAEQTPFEELKVDQIVKGQVII